MWHTQVVLHKWKFETRGNFCKSSLCEYCLSFHFCKTNSYDNYIYIKLVSRERNVICLAMYIGCLEFQEWCVTCFLLRCDPSAHIKVLMQIYIICIDCKYYFIACSRTYHSWLVLLPKVNGTNVWCIKYHILYASACDVLVSNIEQNTLWFRIIICKDWCTEI